MKIGWLAAGAGILIAGGYLVSMNRTNNLMDISLATRIHKVSLSGIDINIDATLKNPTDNAIRMMFPFVKIVHEDKTFGSSQVINQEIEIPQYGQGIVKGILIHIPITSIASVAADIYQQIKTGMISLTLTAETHTDILTGVKKIHYSTTEKIELKKNLKA